MSKEYLTNSPANPIQKAITEYDQDTGDFIGYTTKYRQELENWLSQKYEEAHNLSLEQEILAQEAQKNNTK